MSIHFDVITVFPEMFIPYLSTSILKRASEKKILSVELHDIRAYTHDSHRSTDDTPYGGGGGMVMKPDPIFEAVESIIGTDSEVPLILLTPQGRVFNQKTALEYSLRPRIALLCGHYEGVDERVRQYLVTDEISIGDYVLTGGELPSLILIDAITRLLPGVLGDEDGAMDDSHASGFLEYPHYTRPSSFRGWDIPPVLLSGNHAEIATWRKAQSILRTLQKRPDLFADPLPDELNKKLNKAIYSNLKVSD